MLSIKSNEPYSSGPKKSLSLEIIINPHTILNNFSKISDSIPFYMCVGNHDYGNCNEGYEFIKHQIDYLESYLMSHCYH